LTGQLAYPAAFEVMERLAACAELERSEPLSVLQAYLTAPRLIRRDRLFDLVRARLEESRERLFRRQPASRPSADLRPR
jgi:hypothetical protein